MRVVISDPVGYLISNLEQLYCVKALTIFNGLEVNLDSTFIQSNIKENDIILVYGYLANRPSLCGLGEFKFFRRFRDSRDSDKWNVGENKWDALFFIPNKDIKVFGMGVFEKYPNGGGNFTLGYKYIIENAEKVVQYESPLYREEVGNPEEIKDHVI